MITKRHLLILAAFAPWFSVLCFASSQPLPTGWWQQSSPEILLTKAKSITHDLSYFQGSKAHLLHDENTSLEFFQRKIPDGTIETKSIMYIRGSMLSCYYKIKSGTYYFAHGQVIKIQFEEYTELEQSLATKFDHPYDYQMLKPEIIGTNDCIVVARIMTQQFLEAMKSVLYNGYTREQEDLLGDPINFIKSEEDSYIRKSDGIIIGDIKRNKSGKVLQDRLYNIVQVDTPIPNGEFIVPKGPIEIATSFDQIAKINSKGTQEEKTGLITTQNKWKRPVVIGFMVISLGILLWVIKCQFLSRNTKSIGNSER